MDIGLATLIFQQVIRKKTVLKANVINKVKWINERNTILVGVIQKVMLLGQT